MYSTGKDKLDNTYRTTVKLGDKERFDKEQIGVKDKEVHVRFLQKKRRRRVLFDPSFDSLLHFNLSSLLG